jgi:hypothetical protein
VSGEDARVADAIRSAAGAVHAPQRLRREIAAQRARRAVRRRAAGALAATAATTLATLLALSQPEDGGDRRPPTIAEAAVVALREPALPAPPRDARAPAFLRASSGSVAFPDYAGGGLRWRADGLLRTHRGGREIVVVTYARPGDGRAGYAIVGGPPLRLTGRASSVVRHGTRFSVVRGAQATIVTWRRGGRTCVLASRQASADALLRMAAWQPVGGAPGRY